MHHFSVELDWRCWALPLCVMNHYGQTIIRVGPICILWWDHDLSDIGRQDSSVGDRQ